jgi:hypothetical protein
MAKFGYKLPKTKTLVGRGKVLQVQIKVLLYYFGSNFYECIKN